MVTGRLPCRLKFSALGEFSGGETYGKRYGSRNLIFHMQGECMGHTSHLA